MAITHEDSNIPQLQINEFKSQADYIAAVEAGEVSENDINLIQENDDEIIATTDDLGVVRSSETYDSGKHVVAVAINPEDGKIYADSRIFWVTYGTTTYNQITSALSENKLPICKYSNTAYIYSTTIDNVHWFYRSGVSSSKYFYWVNINNSNTWNTGTSTVASAADLTNGAVTKVGTSTVGSSAHPIYLKNGTPTQVTSINGNLLTYSDSPKVSIVESATIDVTQGDRLAFLPADQIIVEKTTDGGVTWVDAEMTDDQKRLIFASKDSSGELAIPKIDNKKSCNCAVRVTITGLKFNVPEGTPETEKINYWTPQYAVSGERYFGGNGFLNFWVNTNSDRIQCVLEVRVGSSSTWVTKTTCDGLEGWSGRDTMTTNSATLGGSVSQTSNVWVWRLTFRTQTASGTFNDDELSTTAPTSSQYIYSIRAYSSNVWTKPNSMMNNSHMYSWDVDKNVTFPQALKGKTLYEDGTSLADKYAPKTHSHDTSDITGLDTSLGNKVDKVTGSSLVPDTKISSYDSHLTDTNNPHSVTKSQVGLGNVDNTSDLDKPISTATQNALDEKVNKSGDNISGHLYMTGANPTSSTTNTSQLVFGTTSDNHVAISSNRGIVIVNPSTSSTTGQICLRPGGNPGITVGGTYVSLVGHTHSDKEDISNKVTEINNTSTDTQYPSAKAVNDVLVNRPTVREVDPVWLEYIESTGTQWIDTGVSNSNTPNIKIRFTYYSEETLTKYILGTQGYLSYQIKSDKIQMSSSDYFEYTSEDEIPIKKQTKYQIELGYHATDETHAKRYIKYNDIELESTNNLSFETGNIPIYLFGMRASAASTIEPIQRCSEGVRIYSCQIYNGEELVRDFRPALNQKLQKPGLYDMVSGQYFYNQDTEGDDFSYEKTFDELNYIKGDGNSWVDTGIASTGDIRQKIRIYQNDNTPNSSAIFGARNTSTTNKNYVLSTGINNGSKYYLEYGNNSQAASTKGSIFNEIVDIESKFETGNVISWYVNDELIRSYDKETFTTTSGNLLVFSISGINTSTQSSFNGRIYFYQAYELDVLVSDLIPVKKSDGTICMYDFISGEFKTNQGTGDFEGEKKIKTVNIYDSEGVIIYPETKSSSIIYEDNTIPLNSLPESVRSGGGVLEGMLFNGEFYKGSDYSEKYTPESSKLYLDLNSNKLYRWGTTSFIEVSSSIGLGTTSTTAFNGANGQTAYTHATETKVNTNLEAGIYKISVSNQGHVKTAEIVTPDDLREVDIAVNSDLKAIAKTGKASDVIVDAIPDFEGATVQAILGSIHDIIEENEYVVARAIYKINASTGFADDYTYAPPLTGVIKTATSITDALLKLNTALANAGVINADGSSSGPIEELLTETTQFTLKSNKNNSQLIPGCFYRITDYSCAIAEGSTDISANHAFDIIVLATSNNTINENAKAILHSGDTYFSNSNLNAWELKYNIDTNTVYYMKDEYNNEASYDFKNIMYTVSGVNYYTFSKNTSGVISDNSLTGNVKNNNLGPNKMNVFCCNSFEGNKVLGSIYKVVAINTPNIKYCSFLGNYQNVNITTATSGTNEIQFYEFKGNMNGKTINPKALSSGCSRIMECNTNGDVVDYCLADIFSSRAN